MRLVPMEARHGHVVREALAMYVMDALDAEEKDALEGHVLACEVCAESLAREARLETALDGVAQRASESGAVVVPITLAHRSIAERDSRRARQHRWVGGVTGALAAAAAIVVALASTTRSEPSALGARALWDDASGNILSGTLAESGFVEASLDKLDGG